MHVFCDESGGTGRDDSVFLVAAVSLTAGEATRVMKNFRKKAKLSGEVKGSRLTLTQRELFFDILTRSGSANARVVYCNGLDALGNWALGTLSDRELWTELIVESAAQLGTDGTFSMSVDRRYHGSQAYILQDLIRSEIAGRTRANRVTVQFVDSAASDGIQIADIIANTAYKALCNEFPAFPFHDRFLNTGTISAQPVELKARRPHWLAPLPA